MPLPVMQNLGGAHHFLQLSAALKYKLKEVIKLKRMNHLRGHLADFA
jgi:hypothetical protein